LVLFSRQKDLTPHFHEVGYTDAQEEKKKRILQRRQKYHELEMKNPSSDSPVKAKFFTKKKKK